MSNSNLMNHVLMNKLDDELSKAINEVGGDTSSAKGPWDYPAIIKEQLEAKGMAAELKAGPGIIIRDFHGQKFICGTSGALTTGALNPPSGSYKQPVSEVIEAGTPVQEVFEALFYKILPRMSSVYKGDIIRSDKDGADRYNEEDTRTGLIPNSVYLRLYVANRQEPVYILLSGHGIVNSESNGNTGGGTVSESYVGGVSEYIEVSVNDNVITASLTQKGMEMMSKIAQLSDDVESLKSSLSELNTKTSELESNLNTKADTAALDALDSKTSTELNAVKSSVNATVSTINNLSSKISELEVNLDSKAAASEVNALKSSINAISSSINDISSKVTSLENSVASKANASDVASIQNEVAGLKSVVNSLESELSGKADSSSISELNSKVASLDTKVNSKADVGIVDALSSQVSEVQMQLETKASAAVVQEIQQSVTSVQESVQEIQQTAVTQEQVNTIVEQEVSNVVNNTEVVDGKVKEQIVDALTSDEDNEIKTAVEGVVSDMMAENATSDTSGMVDDLFANL